MLPRYIGLVAAPGHGPAVRGSRAACRAMVARRPPRPSLAALCTLARLFAAPCLHDNADYDELLTTPYPAPPGRSSLGLGMGLASRPPRRQGFAARPCNMYVGRGLASRSGGAGPWDKRWLRRVERPEGRPPTGPARARAERVAYPRVGGRSSPPVAAAGNAMGQRDAGRMHPRAERAGEYGLDPRLGPLARKVAETRRERPQSRLVFRSREQRTEGDIWLGILPGSSNDP